MTKEEVVKALVEVMVGLGPALCREAYRRAFAEEGK